MGRGKEGKALKQAGFAVFVLFPKCCVPPFARILAQLWYASASDVICAHMCSRFSPALILDKALVQELDRDRDLGPRSKYRL